MISLLYGSIRLINYWRLAAIMELVWFTTILAIIGGIAQVFQAIRKRSSKPADSDPSQGY